jgi:hypothetical protein
MGDGREESNAVSYHHRGSVNASWPQGSKVSIATWPGSALSPSSPGSSPIRVVQGGVVVSDQSGSILHPQTSIALTWCTVCGGPCRRESLIG